MTLQNLKAIYSANGCNEIYVKNLAKNDLSKSQIYFSGSFDILNVLPLGEISTQSSKNWKATIRFAWLGDDGSLSIAPHAKFILYPQYPEVRFSGFLLGCKNAPNLLMNQKVADRLLFFAVSSNGTVLGYVAKPNSQLANEFSASNTRKYGVFRVIELPIFQNSRQKLILELLRIHKLGSIKSKKLSGSGAIQPCEATNCGGLTLEAELGITQNGFSEPDYLGWEVKQFGVKNLSKTTSQVITLMTPEPTDGFYKTDGAEAFIRRFGYLDKKINDRMNFNGAHKVGILQSKTGLRMELVGYDILKGQISDVEGKIALIDANDNEAASWSYASMLKHWNRKHNQACYVPSLLTNVNGRSYSFGKDIILGTGTDFLLFLQEMCKGHIYYDPGIKMETMSTKPVVKKRSQFRVKTGNLASLYKLHEFIDITKQ